MTIPVDFAPFRAGRSFAPAAPRTVSPAFTGTFTLLADVSEFQPDIADAAYLAWSKAIVIRAAYGDAHDDHAWYGGVRRQLLHSGGAKFIGIYQYLVAGQDGGAQADALHALVGALQPGEVLIADFEEGQHPMLTAWYNRMLALGYPGKYLWTYTGLNFGGSAGALPVEWIAAYGQGEPSSPHKLWQFTSSFAVPGVGTCDCSVFHGTIDQLAALAVPATVTPAAPVSPPRQQSGTVTSQTTGGHAAVTSADGGWTWNFGGTVPAGAFRWQTGTVHSATTNADALAVSDDGGGTWHYAGTPQTGGALWAREAYRSRARCQQHRQRVRLRCRTRLPRRHPQVQIQDHRRHPDQGKTGIQQVLPGWWWRAPGKA